MKKILLTVVVSIASMSALAKLDSVNSVVSAEEKEAFELEKVDDSPHDPDVSCASMLYEDINGDGIKEIIILCSITPPGAAASGSRQDISIYELNGKNGFKRTWSESFFGSVGKRMVEDITYKNNDVLIKFMVWERGDSMDIASGENTIKYKFFGSKLVEKN